MIIVGTHLDRLANEQRAIQLKELALEKYKDTFYPEVVSVEIVSSVKSTRFFSTNYIEKLQRRIYDIACHLQVFGNEGTSMLEFERSVLGSNDIICLFGIPFCSIGYNPDMPLDDPKALFQQEIPVSFLSLQDAIRQEVATKHSVKSSSRTAPIMDDKTFK